jgi:hypothetical protein
MLGYTSTTKFLIKEIKVGSYRFAGQHAALAQLVEQGAFNL